MKDRVEHTYGSLSAFTDPEGIKATQQDLGARGWRGRVGAGGAEAASGSQASPPAGEARALLVQSESS